MEKPKKASFSLKKFKVPNFSYNESKGNPELNLSIDVKGDYFKENGKYKLYLEFKGSNSVDQSLIIEVNAVGIFKFSETIAAKDIPEYFYANAIAIIFPYVRSFISTLTLQANTGLIMLDTLNLSNLKEALRQNTKIV
ncbi:MAG: protein-export chaperone SecB [Flavobacteriaceae bacterium]